MSDRIEKTIDLRAPVARVWRALTDYQEFGAWFRVKLDQPFADGGEMTGYITHPGYEHLVFTASIVAMDELERFAFTWHPYAIDPQVDYSHEPSTLVAFTLAPMGERTRLTVVESGFDALPENRRDEAFRMNSGGWEAQMENIQAHVGG